MERLFPLILHSVFPFPVGIDHILINLLTHLLLSSHLAILAMLAIIEIMRENVISIGLCVNKNLFTHMKSQ